MRVVITNDDGVESAGIHVLAATFLAAGHDVVVVAPSRDFSGAGASLGGITLAEDIGAGRVDLPGYPELEAWGVAGPPGLCVLAARMGAFGPVPDLVVSGINAGLNTGRAVLHSGTVGAALTAQNFGLSGLAVSTAVSDPWQWDAAAAYALEALAILVQAPDRSVLNLNVPALPHAEIKGLRWARLAPFGEVQTAAAEVTDNRLQFSFRATDTSEAVDAGADLGTDQGLVAAGYATLTALAGLAEAWPEAGPTGAADVEVEHTMVPGAPFDAVHRVPDSAALRSIFHAHAVPALPD